MNRHAYFRQQEKNYLAHHGIKGQKWGIRRFQNPDGSLTEAGKKRYGYNDTNIWSRDRQEKSAQRRKDYINQFNKDNKGHKFDAGDEQALRDQYKIDNGESLGEKLYYQDKTASEVVDAIKNTKNKVSDEIRDIDDDYRRWSELVISEVSNKPLKSPYFANQEQVEDFYMKYIDPEGYKIKEEKKQTETNKYLDNYKKDFTEKQYKYLDSTYYEKEKNGVLYSFTNEDNIESLKTMKYVEQNQKRLKKQWDDEIYNYLKDDMAHWIEDENGNIPSKEEIMKDIKLSTVTATGHTPIVNIWYDDGNNGKFLLGGHSVDFDYIIGDEAKKNDNKDYRFNG